jgi:hypothetical protein
VRIQTSSIAALLENSRNGLRFLGRITHEIQQGMDHSSVGYAIGPQTYGRQRVEGGSSNSQSIHLSRFATGGICTFLYLYVEGYQILFAADVFHCFEQRKNMRLRVLVIAISDTFCSDIERYVRWFASDVAVLISLYRFI